MSIIVNPVEQFFDTDGSPLDSGYLYFGAVNGNPETQPTQVYWDAANTIPAAQPIRTINGYPVRNNSPAAIYSINDVSIQVRNKSRQSVFYTATSNFSDSASNTLIRTSNTLLTASDNGKTVIATGTFTQSFDASVALGAGWHIQYVNAGTGVITLDPNLAELIDGFATESLAAGESCTILCNGIGMTTSGMVSSLILSQNNTSALTTGTAPNYLAVSNYVLKAYTTRQRLNISFHQNGTTGSNTINVAGLGAKNLKQLNSIGVKIPADIYAGMNTDIVYDGTDYLVLNPIIPSVQTGSLTAHAGVNALSGYLLCPIAQTNISRTTYSNLWAALHKESIVTITIASPAVITWTTHGLANDNPIAFSTTGALPTGLVANTVYYIVNVLTNSFQLSLTIGGAAINTSGSQSGVHTAYYAPWGIGDGSTTFGLPWFPADYTLLQANLNIATQSVGAVISHNHAGLGGANFAVSGATNSGFQAGTGGTAAGTTANTGGSANLAAGVRTTIWIKY